MFFQTYLSCCNHVQPQQRHRPQSVLRKQQSCQSRRNRFPEILALAPSPLPSLNTDPHLNPRLFGPTSHHERYRPLARRSSAHRRLLFLRQRYLPRVQSPPDPNWPPQQAARERLCDSRELHRNQKLVESSNAIVPPQLFATRSST